jgi:hypothetical protein
MKQISIGIFLFFIFITQTKAQQNLFNIPSADITPKGKFFYQHQINTYSNKFESKGHFVYGLGKGWDAGINLVGTGAYFSPNWKPIYNNDFSKRKALSPTILATLQKQFVLNEKWAANIGTQSGLNLTTQTDRINPAYFHYGLVSYQAKPGTRILFGPYVTNNQYVGAGNTAGVQMGYEWKVAKDFYLMGDFISGRNDSSVMVQGVMYNVSNHVQLCLGYMLPNPNTQKNQAIVFEFNWYGWNFRNNTKH